jgi:hypothetical protein
VVLLIQKGLEAREKGGGHAKATEIAWQFQLYEDGSAHRILLYHPNNLSAETDFTPVRAHCKSRGIPHVIPSGLSCSISAEIGIILSFSDPLWKTRKSQRSRFMMLPRRRRSRAGQGRTLVIALWVNAALLAGVLLALLGRGNPLGGTAMAAPTMTPPIAGGGGMFLMPAQFSMSTWGCYIMDIDKQTLCAYQFYPSEKQLRLVAARDFANDRSLKAFNTSPSPDEMQKLIEVQNNPARQAEPTPPPAAPDPGN